MYECWFLKQRTMNKFNKADCMASVEMRWVVKGKVCPWRMDAPPKRVIFWGWRSCLKAGWCSKTSPCGRGFSCCQSGSLENGLKQWSYTCSGNSFCCFTPDWNKLSLQKKCVSLCACARVSLPRTQCIWSRLVGGILLFEESTCLESNRSQGESQQTSTSLKAQGNKMTYTYGSTCVWQCCSSTNFLGHHYSDRSFLALHPRYPWHLLLQAQSIPNAAPAMQL